MLGHLIRPHVTSFFGDIRKTRVFSTPPHDIAELRERKTYEVNILRNDPAMVRRAVEDMRRRCRLCLQREGGHVEGVGA